MTLPRAVAVLGELGPCVLHWQGRFYGLPSRGGTVLCASSDGAQMFALRPIRDAGKIKARDHAIHASELHSRFTHKRADALYNCFVPAFRKPEFKGELVIVRYLAAKAIDDDGDELVEWEHYFEEPGRAPAYAELWSVGHGQFFIPRGPWKVGERGIEHARHH